MDSLKVFVDHELKIVKVTATGELVKEDGEQIITLGRKTAAEHGYNVLYDIRQATTKVSLAGWFNLPRDLPVYQNPQTRRVRAAVLASPQDKAIEDYKFYEMVTENIGIKLRFFLEEAEALSWFKRSHRRK